MTTEDRRAHWRTIIDKQAASVSSMDSIRSVSIVRMAGSGMYSKDVTRRF